MNNQRGQFLVVPMILAALFGVARADETTFMAEKAKAMKYPYAEDLGPSAIDVSSYPAEMRDIYEHVFLMKCQRCHGAARALNTPRLAIHWLPAEWRGRFSHRLSQ